MQAFYQKSSENKRKSPKRLQKERKIALKVKYRNKEHEQIGK